MIDTSVGYLGQCGFGSKGDAEPGFRNHRNIVRAITDREGLFQSQAKFRSYLGQHIMLATGVDDAAFRQAGQLAVACSEHIGLKPLKPDLTGYRLDERGETTRDQDGRRSPRPHRPDQCCRTCIGTDALGQALVDGRNRQPVEQSNTLLEGSGEIQFAMHRPLGDFGDLRLEPGIVGELVDAFLADHGRIHVGDEQFFLTRSGRVDDDVYTFPTFKRRAHFFSDSLDLNVCRIALIDPAQQPGPG